MDSKAPKQLFSVLKGMEYFVPLLSGSLSAYSPRAGSLLMSDSAAKNIYCYLTMQWSTNLTSD